MKKRVKKYKVGLESETYAISLVESPAIEETLVALEEQKEIKIQLANEEKHMVYSAVLVPDKPIYRRNEDGDEFYVEFTKESIEHMSQQFFKEYRQNEVTLDHETTASDITVVESWIKADLYKDKSVALGLNPELPVGTWFCAMTVNQIDVWDRIKSGELNGFSVESLIRLEEFSKQEELNNKDMINIDEMSFWTKMKEVLVEVFSKKEDIEPINEIDLEAHVATKEDLDNFKDETGIDVVFEEDKPVTEPTPEPVTEPTPEPVTEPTPEPVQEPKVEEPKPAEPNPLEELVKNLTEEIKALKESNKSLQGKIKDLSKQPSAAPVNTKAKPSACDTYAQWRETLRGYIG